MEDMKPQSAALSCFYTSVLEMDRITKIFSGRINKASYCTASSSASIDSDGYERRR